MDALTISQFYIGESINDELAWFIIDKLTNIKFYL